MDARISKVLDHIEDHLASKLGLKDLAEVACMSPGHFHRTFKRDTGRTPFQFIEEIKMNKAFQTLVGGSKTVHELTWQLGYKDYETFSRAFKKHHAIAPDDLKSIAQKIREETDMGPENIIIKTFEVEELHEVKAALDNVVDKLKELMIEKGYTEEDLKQAKVMSVMPKIISTDDKALALVKNKFVIAENQKIWQQLLSHTQHGNS